MMRRYHGLAAVVVVLMASSCVPTKPTGWQPVASPTMEQLGGTWVGEWMTEKLHGGIVVNIRPASSYAVTTIDGDPYTTKNTWQSAVSIAGDQVIIDANGFERKETYNLYTDIDGGLVLDGSYTFKGNPWGKVTLHKQPS